MANTSQDFRFPDHVPYKLCWDNSMGAFAQQGEDPFLAISRLHNGPDIFYAPDISQQIPVG